MGEFLTLLGAFLSHRVYAVLATGGVILGAVYLLWAYQRMWHGPLERDENRGSPRPDRPRVGHPGPLVAAIIVLGLFPAGAGTGRALGPACRRADPGPESLTPEEPCTRWPSQHPAAAPARGRLARHRLELALLVAGVVLLLVVAGRGPRRAAA